MTLYFDLPRTTPVPADPAPWRDHGPSPRPAYAAVGSALLAVLALAAGVWSVALGDLRAALACAVAALILGHLSGLLLTLWVRPHNTGDRMRISGIDDGSPGLTFAYSRRLYYWYASFLTLLTLAQLALIASAPPLAAGAALTGAGLYVLLRHAPGRLALTPDGVYHRGMWTEQFVPWTSIRAIVPGEQARIPVIGVPAVAGARVRTRRTLLRGPDTMVVQVPWLAADPALVLQAMRWYHANPAHRFELSYHLAVERIRQRAWHLH
ncbi:hypothetical protein [Actinoplanes siamensis]|uniref:PH domain-containing protein n=1 Tax=Actinoplanes siamensis TaxID=1223317 RepID=A0A919NBU3_9ACTN|nr:hypothetical protein [Actinoplanes siamensis]GIF07996.1 hypothetical protein Asi03nite_55340 [Actinoplanes siamensis]